MVMSRLPDLQSAVRRIDGVASATVRWPDPHGPATLRVEFAEDADRASVTDLVIATLREVAGVDVDDIRLDMHPATDDARTDVVAGRGHVAQPLQAADHGPAATHGASEHEPPHEHKAAHHAGDAHEDRTTAPASTAVFREHAAREPVPAMAAQAAGATGATGSNGRSRPVFSGMTIDRGDLDTRVVVTLAIGSRAYTGAAEGLATRRSTPKTAATATLSALQELLPATLRVQLEWLDVMEPTEAGRPAIVQSAVTCLSRAGEEVYIGTAIVRTDLREAAVRATLDALNRQLFRWRDTAQMQVPA